MKKAYIVPSVDAISISAQTMLATSKGELPIEPENPGVPATQKMYEDFWSYEWK
jgi:hypothetical protein